MDNSTTARGVEVIEGAVVVKVKVVEAAVVTRTQRLHLSVKLLSRLLELLSRVLIQRLFSLVFSLWRYSAP